MKRALLSCGLAFALGLHAGNASGQQQTECPDPPGNPATGNRIQCEELSDSTNGIDIKLNNFDITPSVQAPAVRALHRGSGDISIRTTGGLISTTGSSRDGISAELMGDGRIDIDVTGTSIETSGSNSEGIYGRHRGEGNLRIEIQETDIVTRGSSSPGIHARGTSSHTGGIEVNMSSGSITTEGAVAYGIYSASQGTDGDIGISMSGGSITTEGASAYGIRTWSYGIDSDVGSGIDMSGGSITTKGGGAYGIYGLNQGGDGDIDIDMSGGSITTEGANAYGISASHQYGGGDVGIDMSGGSITTEGYGAYGILGWTNGGDGDIDINMSGGSITTEGRYAHGIYGVSLNGGGDVGISVTGDSSIRTTGTGAHGIYSGHGTGDGQISIDIGQGVSVHASGTDASGIRVGRSDAQTGALSRVAKMGPDGYRRQTVTVNGTVTGGSGDAAGVYLFGGGKVFVGPQGYVSADSGVAICAFGDDPLYVDIELGGRLMKEAVDGEILNDGRIDLVVNGALLHDGATGPTGRWSANGVWDVLAQREAAKFEFVEVYAPRAVLYESLPGLLLRVDESPPRRRPETPAWTQVEHAVGHGEPAHSRTGARYDYDRTEMLAGMSHAWDGGVSGSLWLRGVRVAAETEVVSGRGELDVRGVGAGLEARWRGEDGLELSGQLSLTDYDVDASSRRHGRLLREVGARALEASLAGGWRVELGPGATLLPRAWLRHAEVEVDDFTDALGVRASFADESRTSGGLGLLAEWTGPEHSLYGSMDLERLLGGKATAVELSGRRVDASAERTRAWLGFGGESRGKWLTLRGGVRLGDPGGRNEEFAAWFSIAGRF